MPRTFGGDPERADWPIRVDDVGDAPTFDELHHKEGTEAASAFEPGYPYKMIAQKRW